MNPRFRFEIVRRPNDRFGWIFVRIRRDGRRRVLARSVRDYGSPAKVMAAIDKMDGADVDDTTGGEQDPFPLPATSFRFVSGVVPLVVEEFPVEDDDSAFIGQAVALRADASARPAALVVARPNASAGAEASAKAKASPPKAPVKRLPAGKAKPRTGSGRTAS